MYEQCERTPGREQNSSQHRSTQNSTSNQATIVHQNFAKPNQDDEHQLGEQPSVLPAFPYASGRARRTIFLNDPIGEPQQQQHASLSICEQRRDMIGVCQSIYNSRSFALFSRSGLRGCQKLPVKQKESQQKGNVRDPTPLNGEEGGISKTRSLSNVASVVQLLRSMSIRTRIVLLCNFRT